LNIQFNNSTFNYINFIMGIIGDWQFNIMHLSNNFKILLKLIAAIFYHCILPLFLTDMELTVNFTNIIKNAKYII